MTHGGVKNLSHFECEISLSFFRNLKYGTLNQIWNDTMFQFIFTELDNSFMDSLFHLAYPTSSKVEIKWTHIAEYTKASVDVPYHHMLLIYHL